MQQSLQNYLLRVVVDVFLNEQSFLVLVDEQLEMVLEAHVVVGHPLYDFLRSHDLGLQQVFGRHHVFGRDVVLDVDPLVHQENVVFDEVQVVPPLLRLGQEFGSGLALGEAKQLQLVFERNQ